MTFHVGQQHTSLSDLWFSRGFEMCFPLLEGPVTYSSFQQHHAGSGMCSGRFWFELSLFLRLLLLRRVRSCSELSDFWDIAWRWMMLWGSFANCFWSSITPEFSRVIYSYFQRQLSYFSLTPQELMERYHRLKQLKLLHECVRWADIKLKFF